MEKILDGARKVGIGKIAAGAAITAFMAMMLINPSYYLDSARRGLSLYATSVLPSLFPFYFCSLLLTYIGAARAASAAFKKPVKLLFNAPQESAYILILSMLSGYPVGASMTSELYAAGVIDRTDAKKIAAFASTSGPIFMLGTVGSAIYGDVRVGAVILVSHYIAAILNGIIFRGKSNIYTNEKTRMNRQYPAGRQVCLSGEQYDNLMSKTIASSTINMLYVGGYIVLCGMLVDTLPLLGVERVLSSLPGNVAEILRALLSGLIEMTRGCIASSECAMRHISVALSAGIVSLGGLSVTMQNYTFLSKCGLTFFDVTVRKLAQGIIAFCIALALSFCIRF